MSGRIVLLLCAASLTLLAGMAQQPIDGDEDYALSCFWEESQTCSDVQVENCSLICTGVPFGSAIIYGCRDENGEGQTNPTKVVANGYGVVVESDAGFCDVNGQQAAIYCATVYACSNTCLESSVGELCDVNGDVGTGSGRRVRPQQVDIWSGFCPEECLF